jgi:hypothetical protein
LKRNLILSSIFIAIVCCSIFYNISLIQASFDNNLLSNPSATSWSTPEQLSSAADNSNSSCHSLALDEQENLHLIYSAINKTQVSLFHRKFSDNQWSNPIQFYSLNHNDSVDKLEIKTCFDSNDRLHVFWLNSSHRYYCSYYENIWSETTHLDWLTEDFDLAADFSGNVHIVYATYSSSFQLKHRILSNTVWSDAEVIATFDDVALSQIYQIKLAASPGGKLFAVFHLIYTYSSNLKLSFVHELQSMYYKQGSWSNPSLISIDEFFRYSIIFDDTELLHLFLTRLSLGLNTLNHMMTANFRSDSQSWSTIKPIQQFNINESGGEYWFDIALYESFICGSNVFLTLTVDEFVPATGLNYDLFLLHYNRTNWVLSPLETDDDISVIQTQIKCNKQGEVFISWVQTSSDEYLKETEIFFLNGSSIFTYSETKRFSGFLLVEFLLGIIIVFVYQHRKRK